jgi:hypothetical protein
LSKSKVDLDGDSKLREYGDQTPFLPYVESELDVALVAFLYHDGYKGKAYRAKVKVSKVISSDNEAIRAEKVYVLAFPLDGKVEQQRNKKKELRQFVAAVMGADAADESFKANDAIETLVDASAAEALDGFGLHISSRDRGAVDKDTKEPILDPKTKEQKIYTNRNYSALK